MTAQLSVDLRSEIGRLEGVLIHTPGPEIENMTPGNAERALYSDILSREAASRGHAQLEGVLRKVAPVFQMADLLVDVLDRSSVRESLIESICRNENVPWLKDRLLDQAPADLARQLIEGVLLPQDTLTRFLSDERYALRPLHNLFFMRDTAAALGEHVLIGRMANAVRDREALLVEAVLNHHPGFRTTTVNPAPAAEIDDALTLEGGDVMVARDDLLLIGIGARTSPQAVDFVVDRFKAGQESFDVIVQELPRSPESFIHLDMVFTFLDRDACLVYEPVVLGPGRQQTVHMRVAGGRVESITEEVNLIQALGKLGLDLEPVACGGHADTWQQEREQWHSGTNSFALSPGQIVAYGRNVHTIEELDQHGFSVIKAQDVIDSKIDLADQGRCVVTIEGAELARGGGGCRCMTLPLRRASVDW